MGILLVTMVTIHACIRSTDQGSKVSEPKPVLFKEVGNLLSSRQARVTELVHTRKLFPTQWAHPSQVKRFSKLPTPSSHQFKGIFTLTLIWI